MAYGCRFVDVGIPAGSTGNVDDRENIRRIGDRMPGQKIDRVRDHGRCRASGLFHLDLDPGLSLARGIGGTGDGTRRRYRSPAGHDRRIVGAITVSWISTGYAGAVC